MRNSFITDYIEISVLIGLCSGFCYGLFQETRDSILESTFEEELLYTVEALKTGISYGIAGAIIVPTLPITIPYYLFFSRREDFSKD